jgi:RHS repeat-associated protein
VLDDGIVTVDVTFESEVPVLDDPHSEPVVALLVRYRNPQGYYAVGISNNDIALYRRTSSGFEQVAYGSISVTGLGITQKLQVTTDGNRLIVFWNGEYIFHWDDPNPWLTGKVGFRHLNSSSVQWDNIRVTTGGPGKIVAYDDFDPWGMVLEGRSGNNGNADARFKFTGKERDTETGLDYFGARYYDQRIGRWISVDPLAEKYPAWSPYAYVLGNPLKFVDPNGLWTDPVNKPTYRGWYVSGGKKEWAPEKSKFGEGVRGGGARNHQGVDLGAKVGTEVKAVENGKIVKVKDSKDFGKTIMLQFKDKDGNTVYAQYSHLSESSVKEGAEVKEGDVVGKSGKTGNAKDLTTDEEHLHFGISTTEEPQAGMGTYKDPENYMKITTPEKPKDERKEGEQ